MIYGTGIDILHVARIAKVHQRHGERFVERLLHPAERAGLSQVRDAANYLTKAFAVKEAFVKALGTGFRGVAHDDIGFIRGELGRPQLIYSESLAAKLSTLGVIAGHVSLSDDEGLVCAMVTLEGAA